jgi:hypothetical protein
MQSLVAQVLAAWRNAERLTNELPPATAEHAAASAACERLRHAYQELTRWDGWVAEEEARAAVSELDREARRLSP